ncbi:MAG: alpha-galactosidase, partial [Verrucomicrobia bacterium]|nr:alpha-galactosidase [Verrucomicrobiota bacterium]
PVVEWTVYLKNAGKRNTPIIEQLQSLDAPIERGPIGQAGDAPAVRLHYHVGSPTKPEDYRPLVAELVPGCAQRIATSGGRPCNAHMPFFNLEWPEGGVIAAIGWGGQWAAEFRRGGRGSVRIKAGQELTHFTLHPGEEVRTPLIALLFYQGDCIRSQNIWRRWMIAHNLPRPGGTLPSPLLHGGAFSLFAPIGFSNVQANKVFIDTYEAKKIPIDIWWIDAGWYDCEASYPAIGYSVWNQTGTWETDRRRFPNGVCEANDHAHKKGLKTVLWFEPERVVLGTWLAQTHPEWLLTAPPNTGNTSYDATMRLLNMGNPAALQWVIEHFDGLLTREHVDIYREDFNMDPLDFWRANDTPDRQGMTEIKHVMGHLAYWDELQRRHPGMLMDICASGGKRNDLEGLRRAVPLCRSDFGPGMGNDAANLAKMAGGQCITYGMAFWIPYFGTGIGAMDTYRFRSMMCSSLGFGIDPRRDDVDYDLWRELAAQFKQVAPYYFGDYYPLTEYSLENDVWMAWQFDLPEKGEGMVQAFRREQSRRASLRLKLRGLCPERTYIVTNLDDNRTLRLTGRTLIAEGLPVTLKSRPESGLWIYRRAGQRKT